MVTNFPLPQLTYGPLLRALVHNEAAQGLPLVDAPSFAFMLPGDGVEHITKRFTAPFGAIGQSAFVVAILTVMALPVGTAIGYALGQLIMLGFSNEIYRLSFTVSRATVAWTCLTVIGAAFLSGLVVRRRLDRLDLVGVLKTRE